MWSLVCLEKLLCGLSSAANSSMSLEAGSPQLGKDLAASLTFLLSQESISRTRVRTPTVRFLPILRGSPKEGPKVIPPWLWEIPGLCCLAGLEKRETNVRMWGINNSRHQEPSLGELAKRLAKRFPLLLADPDSHSCFFLFLLSKRMLLHPRRGPHHRPWGKEGEVQRAREAQTAPGHQAAAAPEAPQVTDQLGRHFQQQEEVITPGVYGCTPLACLWPWAHFKPLPGPHLSCLKATPLKKGISCVSDHVSGIIAHHAHSSRVRTCF